jgi:hypothetical protein
MAGRAWQYAYAIALLVAGTQAAVTPPAIHLACLVIAIGCVTFAMQ